MCLDCMSMCFIDQITSDVREFVGKNKLQKARILDVLIKILKELKKSTKLLREIRDTLDNMWRERMPR
ncbi:hypothetical protein LCGC14_2743870 [marine sediment metagenome]|uniref:Uncharacterized protein n=1 Tax=marine sediment metagenome TaxID=412755 RepID=A0A0F8Z3U2_9ZZZZ